MHGKDKNTADELGNIDGIEIHFLGSIVDQKILVSVYHSADIFLFPSIQETQGMTKVEAMLCGLPVIAFDRTACAEGIEQGVTGWVAADGDFEGFSKGMINYYTLFKLGEMDVIHENVARSATREYSTKTIVESIMSAYKGAER